MGLLGLGSPGIHPASVRELEVSTRHLVTIRHLVLSPGARNQEMWSPLEAGKGKKTVLPYSLQKEHSPFDTLILAPEIQFGFLTFRTM